ncbi:MAG: SDR family oxidoreductase [Candidatus Dormibacteraceae bacterium]
MRSLEARIIGLTKPAAFEAASLGVQVTAVAPSPVQTAMLERVTGHDPEVKAALPGHVSSGRSGEGPEIAQTIAHTTSEQAGFLTEQTIFVDGGFAAA